MVPWFVRRILSSLLLVCLLLTGVFFIVRLAPGDPLDQVVGEELSAGDRELMREKLQLDEPLARQFLTWAGGVVRGDLNSYVVEVGMLLNHVVTPYEDVVEKF